MLTVPTENSNVHTQGWIKSVRVLKKVAFVDLYDGTTHETVLVVTSPDIAGKLRTGVSVKVLGDWKKSKGASQKHEINASEITVLGQVEDSYPLQKKYHTTEYVRSLTTLKFKTSKIASTMRFRSFLEYKLNEFFYKENFIKTAPPVITASDCEGAGEMFKVEADKKPQFFGTNAYLTVSAQLHLEILAQSLTKVWCLNPAFRAEASDTNRHLSEFWMLEAEMAFVDDVSQLTQFSEKMIRHLVTALLENQDNALDNLLVNSRRSAEEILEIESRLSLLENSQKKWNQITYNQAIEILQSTNNSWEYLPPVIGKSLTTEHEKFLTGQVFKAPVFVTDYPANEKAFYMKLNSDNTTVACFDLLFPSIGELIGGSVRELRYEPLREQLAARGMAADGLSWYLDLRKNGSVPHGGFGMGIERLISYICNVDNVKDVIPLPRTIGSCQC